MNISYINIKKDLVYVSKEYVVLHKAKKAAGYPLHFSCRTAVPRIMLLTRVLLITSGLVEVAKSLGLKERHWVHCLKTIATRHFSHECRLVISLPSAGDDSSITKIGHHFVTEILQANLWPLVVRRGSGDANCERTKS